MGDGVFVVGATGPTGELVARALRTEGRSVVTMHRSEKRRDEFEAIGAVVLLGDAMDAKSTRQATRLAAKNCSVVVNLMGGNPFADESTWPDYTGAVHTIDAAREAGIRRYILVTSVGTGRSYQYVPEEAFLHGILNLKTRSEEYLKESGLDWTIIKPGGLGPPGTVQPGDDVLITENHGVRGLLAREDLADIVLRVIHAPAELTNTRELYAVAAKKQFFEGEAEAFALPAGDEFSGV